MHPHFIVQCTSTVSNAFIQIYRDMKAGTALGKQEKAHGFVSLGTHLLIKCILTNVDWKNIMQLMHSMHF